MPARSPENPDTDSLQPSVLLERIILFEAKVVLRALRAHLMCDIRPKNPDTPWTTP
jgi:hypothetical protein